jgi:hypothetical protein
MFAKFISWVIGVGGGGLIDKVMGHLERKANTETERLRIRAARETNASNNAAAVIRAGMQHKAFWVPWLIATIPTTLWFGWGMMDSLFNGLLPDVSELPPQLKEYADIVFGNIFYTGAAGIGATALGSIANSLTRRK